MSLVYDGQALAASSMHAPLDDCELCCHLAVAQSTTEPPSERAGKQLFVPHIPYNACHKLSGFVEVCLMHPLDLIKTRFQVQAAANNTLQYSSLADCFRTIYRSEGFLSFYKGILPPILAETPKRAVGFLTFEQYKRFFLFGADAPTALTFTLAGLGSGLTEAVAINPFEVVKVKLQTDMVANFKQQSSAYQVARNIIKTEGIRGLNKGLTSTLGRHGVFNMVYFSFYHNIKGLVPQPEDPSLDLVRRFTIGFCAGTLASCINIPFDVAKSRIQGPQPVPGQLKYKGCMQTIGLVYSQEGYLALYKGLLPKVMRLGPGRTFSSYENIVCLIDIGRGSFEFPGGAIMLVVFDYVYEKLQKVF